MVNVLFFAKVVANVKYDHVMQRPLSMKRFFSHRNRYGHQSNSQRVGQCCVSDTSKINWRNKLPEFGDFYLLPIPKLIIPWWRPIKFMHFALPTECNEFHTAIRQMILFYVKCPTFRFHIELAILYFFSLFFLARCRKHSLQTIWLLLHQRVSFTAISFTAIPFTVQ